MTNRHSDNSDKFKIFYACQEGDTDTYDELMRHGMDPNIVDDLTQNRPIHVAVDNGSVEIVRRMLDDPRIDPTVAGHGWFQPIEIAQIRKYKIIIELFKAHGIEKLEVPRLPREPHKLSERTDAPQFG